MKNIKPNNEKNTISLKIRDDIFLLETTEILSFNTLLEIENLCHSAYYEDSEFNEMRIECGYDIDFFEMSSEDILEILQKVIQKKLNVEFVPMSINVVKLWI